MDPTHLSARLDGQALNHSWFPHRDFADGGCLEINLGPKPNTRWGSAWSVAPPSESAYDPVKVPAGKPSSQSKKTNIAPAAKVSTSSDFPDPQFAASKAVDETSADWSSTGEPTPWIQLDWEETQPIARIILKDRPNKNDHTIAGTLSFSDGSTVKVTSISNDGSAKIMKFPRRNAT